MKAIYSDLKYLQQLHSAGLVSMQITPREWLAADPVIDFETGRVLETIQLKPNRFWLSVQFTPASFSFAENPKDTKSGDYYEVSTGGLLNTFNYALQQVLETIRYSELVVTVKDKNKRRKIIGDTQAAMELKVTHTHQSEPGIEKVQLDLTYSAEGLPPYYNPDNTPDALGNFLVNSTGDFLLVG